MSKIHNAPRERIFRRDGRPAIIGHRGLGSGVRDGHAENTMSSLLAAADSGADWVEIDIRRTADDQLVLHHDSMIDGHMIAELDAHSVQVQRLVPFEEFLKSIPPHVGIDIEIKPDLTDTINPKSTVDLMADLLNTYTPSNPTIFTSFETESLRSVRSRDAHAAIGFLTWAHYPLDFAVITAAKMKAEAVCVHVSSLGTPQSSKMKRQEITRALKYCGKIGIDIMVWGAKPDDVPRLLDQGVDALTVDHVHETRELVEAHHARQ